MEWAQRRFENAEPLLIQVLALRPTDPDASRMLAVLAHRRGDHSRAADHFRQALQSWPDDVDLHTGLALSLLGCREAEEAILQLRRACELAPASASTWFNLGQALWQQSFAKECLAPLRRTLDLDGSNIPARLSLARALVSIGCVDAGVAELREVIRRDPGNADGWYELALNAGQFDHADALSLRRAFGQLQPGTRAHYLTGYSLAKALEDQHHYEEAFEALQTANASQASSQPKWEPEAERRFVDTIVTTFGNPVSSDTNLGPGQEVIFITGMPRSGTTLVEQVLAAHPEVEGANEIKDLWQVLAEETTRRGTPFPLWVTDSSDEDWKHMGSEYLRRTVRWRTSRRRFTDKNPANWHLIGAALAMLPAAHVIVVHRDPVETCLACYRHCLTDAAGYACDLDDTANYYIDFWRLTRFWLERYPSRVFDLRYESLVANPEAEVRRLLDFCNLPFDSACLESHKANRAVLTPSAAQVRQPFRTDTARGARYGSRLDALRERLRFVDRPA